mmetsp:Transcript_2932/g.11181  ORF Transcript_2932/g.11181 Transcript_2932/m.11181 type:complete len:290 (-) Transcript_2932:497-1366(-)
MVERKFMCVSQRLHTFQEHILSPSTKPQITQMPLQQLPRNLQTSHKNILVALPSYASIAQLSTALVISSLSAASVAEGCEKMDQKGKDSVSRIATLFSNHVTPVCAPDEEESSVHAAIELYEIDSEWLILMVRGLITQRRQFSRDLATWIQKNASSVENLYVLAGGNAVYCERGFSELDPMSVELWREMHVPPQKDKDMSQHEQDDYLRGEVFYFVQEIAKRREQAENERHPNVHLLMRLCNEGDNRLDAHVTASRVLKELLQRDDVPLVEPKAWACLYGTKGSNLLYY